MTKGLLGLGNETNMPYNNLRKRDEYRIKVKCE